MAVGPAQAPAGPARQAGVPLAWRGEAWGWGTGGGKPQGEGGVPTSTAGSAQGPAAGAAGGVGGSSGAKKGSPWGPLKTSLLFIVLLSGALLLYVAASRHSPAHRGRQKTLRAQLPAFVSNSDATFAFLNLSEGAAMDSPPPTPLPSLPSIAIAPPTHPTPPPIPSLPPTPSLPLLPPLLPDAPPQHSQQFLVPLLARSRGLEPNRTGLVQCISRTHSYPAPPPWPISNGYLVVTANGGLNQMRAAICDMVAVARIMNATLVLPRLDHHSFWSDPSNFEDVFDVKHFIRSVKKDIHVARELPAGLKRTAPALVRPVSWSDVRYYEKVLLPQLQARRVLEFPLTDSRLANNGVPRALQRLRCRVNYEALRYTAGIEGVARALVARLRAKGPFYVALHLRCEKDMLAYTGCDHGLSGAESDELRAMRLAVRRWREKEIDGAQRRRQGQCPLTPREAALLLRGLGFPRNTTIYIASGPVFGSRGLTDFLREFPNTHTHTSLATRGELRALGVRRGRPLHQTRLAAVDHRVALESDVFAFSHAGNMARVVEGWRRFHGHRPTIIPQKREFIRLVESLDAGAVDWVSFAAKVQALHASSTGEPHERRQGANPRTEESFFANPYPGCLCRNK